jgi:uncharacterized protein YndB with AHSA1/START domain
MSSVAHDTFVIERRYDSSPERVFRAWSDPAVKCRWFTGTELADQSSYGLDFRVGGRETNRGGPPGGPVYRYDAVIQDITPNERVIFTYDMHCDDQRISVSVTTIELHADGEGTRLVFTEQGAFLDGLDNAAQRESGTSGLLDQLGASLTLATA